MTETPTLYAPATGPGRSAVSVIRISGTGLGRGDPHPRRPPPRRPGACRSEPSAIRSTAPNSTARWSCGFPARKLQRRGYGRAAPPWRTGGPDGRADGPGRAPGCRAAGPGAFTRRAVLNGRLDLAEAEAVADLIDAETEGQRRQALRQLDGALSRQVAAWRMQAIDGLAAAEAALDFSDEGDVDEAGVDAGLAKRATALRDEIAAALRDGVGASACATVSGGPRRCTQCRQVDPAERPQPPGGRHRLGDPRHHPGVPSRSGWTSAACP